MRRRVALLLFVMMGGASQATHGQVEPAAAIAQARAQIDAINVDSAATLLRRALESGSGANDRQRLRAFVLLGITELMRRREADARRAFRLALELDPQHRVDSLADLSGDLLTVFNSERAARGPQAVIPAGRQTVLEVRGLPEAATLSVDGVAWQSPRGPVSPGVHRIEVGARGFEPYRDTVAVREGEVTVKTVRMAAALPATLSVTSEPWGTVYLDGQRIGETPVIGRLVPAGGYSLVLESPGRPPVTQRVQLQSGSHLRLPLLGSGGVVPRSSFPFTAADSLYRATRFDQALPVYQRILTDTSLALTDDQRAAAATRIGMIFYATARGQNRAGDFDSAQSYFRIAYALAPAYAPSPGDVAPELRSAIDLAREGSFRLAVSASMDTLVSAVDGRFRLVVRPPRQANVMWRIIAAEGGRVVLADTQMVEGTREFDWTVGAAGGENIPLGRHTLLVQATDSAGEASPTIEYLLTVSREAVDTALMPAPVPPSLLLPESQRVERGWHLVRGIVFGAMAAAVPVYAAVEFTEEPTFATGGFVVGGALALGGIVGFLKGERQRPAPRNIERNRRLLEEDALTRQGIADANRAARSAARIRVVGERVR